MPTYVVLEVTNIGYMPLNIIQFIWKAGMVNKKYAVQIPDYASLPPVTNIKFPIDLYPGKQVRHFIPYEVFLKNSQKIFHSNAKLAKFSLWLEKRFWKLGIETTLGKKMYFSKISKDIQNDLMEVLKNNYR